MTINGYSKKMYPISKGNENKSSSIRLCWRFQMKVMELNKFYWQCWHFIEGIGGTSPSSFFLSFKDWSLFIYIFLSWGVVYTRRIAFLNRVELNWIWIILNYSYQLHFFRLIWNQTEFRFVPNQSGNAKQESKVVLSMCGICMEFYSICGKINCHLMSKWTL